MPGLVRQVAKFALRPIYRQDTLWDWKRRRQNDAPRPPEAVRDILVICHGNICRSPYAEHWLAAALPDCRVTSAGLQATAGKAAYPTALEIAAERGIDLSHHRARVADAETLAAADLIVGMVGHHIAHSIERSPAARQSGRVLGHYLPGPPYGIEDPWGEPPDVFRAIFDQIEVAADRLAEMIRGG
jgi:protein-tyrosine phosphatase